MAQTIRHPVFARMYDFMSRAAEVRGVAEHRAELLQGLSGRVIEIGAGNGHNFVHYPNSVTEVVAVEPERFLRNRAIDAAKAAPIRVTVVDGTAEHLPADDAEFDAAVFSLVLCSVRDPQAALAEARRALKPGAQLRIYEHVAADGGVLAATQRGFDLVWPRMAGGCHTSRDTARAVEQAGFEITEMKRFRFAPVCFAKPLSPHVLATAVRPTDG